MSDDPKKTLDDLIDRMVEDELALSDGELEAEIEAEQRDNVREGGSPPSDAPAGDLGEEIPPGEKASARATTRSTSGVAYEFEDIVAASLAVRAMAGTPMPGAAVAGDRMQFQTAALGWSVDDLRFASDAPRRQVLAISCKSNLQVSVGGFPAEFIGAVWSDWVRLDGSQRESIVFALVTRGKHDGFEKIWADIKDWLAQGVTPLALARIAQSARHKRVFDSVRLNDARTEEETGHLVRQLQLIATDFQLENSRDEEAAIERCRTLLTSGLWQDARALWAAVVEEARKARTGHGEISVAGLWACLRTQFDLRDHPDLASSWEVLRQITEDGRERIVVALPNGHRVPRTADESRLVSLLQSQTFGGLHGESGAGKSALVVETLNKAFPSWSQVWLRAEELDLALSAAKRSSLGLKQTLDQTLLGTSKAENVLVLDAAERYSEELVVRARKLVEALLGANDASAPSWRVLVISQSEAGAGVRAGLGLTPEAQLGLEDPSLEEVQAALRSSQHLNWLASHEDAVAVLRNLKTLAFVMQAESAFAAQGAQTSYSRSAIADVLWSWWTTDSAVMSGLLVRLAERDASFQRSIGVSELEPAQADAFDKRTLRTPLRVNRQRRIEFTHDLAADWARYQRLREIAFDPDKWAPLAENPIWLAALRMLGEFLLREKIDGENAWDHAFRRLEANRAARDVLLDALCLDPLAEQFLTGRADVLLADDGAMLLRLVQRFLHVATVAAVPLHILTLDPTLRLLFEAQHRAPIISRWFGMVRFLDSRRDDVARLMSPSIARLCETWLTGVPSKIEGLSAVPFRPELSALALATARELQVAQETHRYILGGEVEEPIYKAAFASSADRPDDIAGWALEMAGRREVSETVQVAVSEFHRREAQAHQERMRTNPAYRLQHERKRAMAGFSGFYDRDLPPWPLGARRRVEQDFQRACLHKNALNELMKVRPAEAGEVLLACIIDDTPTERRYERIDGYLGLAFDSEAYPTIYWSSPFLAFLWADQDQALADLVKLIEFCTERWAEPAEGRVYHFDLVLGGGETRTFTGNYAVFEWGEAESTGSGQLFCALAALEFWLCSWVDAGQEVDALLERLLRICSSAAMLGVLVNVGKHKPDLFRGPLKPLLARCELYRWDDHRVKTKKGYRFNAMHWARSGETVFQMAKSWAFAPRHETTLAEAALQLMLEADDVAAFLQEAVRAWPQPTEEKERLEIGWLAAQLDRGNYEKDSDGGIVFNPPDTLVTDIEAFNEAHAPAREAITLPIQCLNFLETGKSLNEKDCDRLASTLNAEPLSVKPGQDGASDGTKMSAQIASAGTLLARGGAYLEAHPEVAERARGVVDAAVASIGEDAEGLRKARFDFASYDLLFVAHAAVETWRREPLKDHWQRVILKLISSRHSSVVSTLMHAAKSVGVGSEERRAIENAALLWSALSALAPGYDADETANARWVRWVEQFRHLPLRALATVNLDLSDLSVRVDRLSERRHERGERRGGRRRAVKRLRTGLDNEVLGQIYADVLNHERKGPVDTPDDRRAVLSLWALCVRGLKDEAADSITDDEIEDDHPDDGEYALPDRLGYAVVHALARMAGFAPPNEAAQSWRGVLELGPRAHSIVDYFLGLWFLHPGRGVDAVQFIQTWREMAEFVLRAPAWNGEKLWYRREHTLRQVLGFGSDRWIEQLTDGESAVSGMWDIYAEWADAHLSIDEDNVTGFAHFLASAAGRDIRVRGCLLLAAHVAVYSSKAVWRRDRAGSALVDLSESILTQHAEQVKSDEALRTALLKVVAALAAKNTPGALVLQERIRELK